MDGKSVGGRALTRSSTSIGHSWIFSMDPFSWPRRRLARTTEPSFCVWIVRFALRFLGPAWLTKGEKAWSTSATYNDRGSARTRAMFLAPFLVGRLGHRCDKRLIDVLSGCRSKKDSSAVEVSEQMMEERRVAALPRGALHNQFNKAPPSMHPPIGAF